MKHSFYLFMLIVGLGLVIPRSWEHKTAAATDTPRTSSTASYVLPDAVTPIDAHGNAYSGSLSAAELRALADAGTRVIVRLNGDTQVDRGHLSIGQEAELCEELGLRFYYENIEGREEEAGRVVNHLMRQGGVVVHCRNGAHRAPAMAAYHLRVAGVAEEDIIQLVGWQELVRAPGEYARYITAVLPGVLGAI